MNARKLAIELLGLSALLLTTAVQAHPPVHSDGYAASGLSGGISVYGPGYSTSLYLGNGYPLVYAPPAYYPRAAYYPDRHHRHSGHYRHDSRYAYRSGYTHGYYQGYSKHHGNSHGRHHDRDY